MTQRIIRACCLWLVTGFAISHPVAQHASADEFETSLITAAGAEDKWQSFSSDTHRFIVQFPGKPEERQIDNTFEVLLEMNGGAAVYLVGATPISANIFDEETAERMFKVARDTLLERLEATRLISERKVKFSGVFPARDLEVEVPRDGIYRVRFLITPSQFYQIVMVGPKDFVDGAEAKKFASSFALRE